MKSLWLFCFSIILIGCGVSKKCSAPVDERMPMDNQARINVGLNLDRGQFIEWVDALVPDTIFKNDDLNGQGISVEVFKNGSPAVDIVGKAARITMPLRIAADRDMGFFSANAKGSLFLTLFSEIDIAEDWTWSSKTSIENLEWVEEPKLKIMGMKLSVSNMVEQFINNSEGTITAQIDSTVADRQLLRDAIGALNPTFERAYALDPDRSLFVQVIPVSAGVVPFEATNRRIKTAVQVMGRGSILADSSDLETDLDTARYLWGEFKPNEPSVDVSLAMTETQLQSIIRSGAKGETFEFRGKKSSVDQIFVTLQEEKLKADVHLSGGLKGKVHFEGKPRWDEGKNEIEFCDADVDLKIDKGISKFLLWLGGNALKKRLISEMEDAINQEVRNRIREVNSYLRDYKPGKNLEVKGQIFDHKITPLYIKDKTLNLGVQLELRGKVVTQGLVWNIE